MTSNTRIGKARLAFVSILGASLFALPSPSAHADTGDGWQVTVTPYLWLPSVETDLGIGDLPRGAETQTDAVDILSKLDFGMLIGGEVRKEKFSLTYDFQYLKLSDDGTTDGPAPRDFDSGVTIADATLALGYRVVDEPKVTLDVLGGVRVLYAKAELDFEAGAVLPAVGDDRSETWVDPIVGVKGSYRFADPWSINGYADVGGFGISSDLTYQVMATVGYAFNENVTLQVGYRAFGVEFESDDFEFDILLHGPLVGLTFRF